MRSIATEVREEYDAEQADRWLADARGLGRDVLRADKMLGTAESSLRYNPRAISRPHAGTSLRTGLDAVERVIVSLRGVCRGLADLVRGSGEETVYGPDVREALSDLLRDVADAVEAYGALVGSEVVGTSPEDQRLREALSASWADRHRLAAMLRHEDRMRRDEWQLHGALMTHIDQLLRDVDSQARAELRRGWPEREHVIGPALRQPVRHRPRPDAPPGLRVGARVSVDGGWLRSGRLWRGGGWRLAVRDCPAVACGGHDLGGSAGRTVCDGSRGWLTSGRLRKGSGGGSPFATVPPSRGLVRRHA